MMDPLKQTIVDAVDTNSLHLSDLEFNKSSIDSFLIFWHHDFVQVAGSTEDGQEEKKKKLWKHLSLQRCRGDGIDTLLQCLLGATTNNLTQLLLYDIEISMNIASNIKSLLVGSLLPSTTSNERATKINVLSLNVCSFSAHEVVIELAEGFRGNKTLTYLNCFDCGLQDEDISVIVTALQESQMQRRQKNLEYLNLSKNNGGKLALKAINNLLLQKSSSSSPPPPTTTTTTSQEEESSIHSKNKNNCKGQNCLHELILAFQQPKESTHGNDNANSPLFDVSLLSSGLDTNTSLQSLFLRGTQITFDGIRSLVDNALLCCSNKNHRRTIRELVLTDCHICHDGMLYIGKNLHLMNELKKLAIDGSQKVSISKKKQIQKTFRESLKANRNLEELYLPFGFDDCLQILTLLDYNRAGRKLLLDTFQNNTNNGGGDDNGNGIILSSLWPLVLERVNTMELMHSLGTSHQIADSYRRSTMLYLFLLEGSII